MSEKKEETSVTTTLTCALAALGRAKLAPIILVVCFHLAAVSTTPFTPLYDVPVPWSLENLTLGYIHGLIWILYYFHSSSPRMTRLLEIIWEEQFISFHLKNHTKMKQRIKNITCCLLCYTRLGPKKRYPKIRTSAERFSEEVRDKCLQLRGGRTLITGQKI